MLSFGKELEVGLKFDYKIQSLSLERLLYQT